MGSRPTKIAVIKREVRRCVRRVAERVSCILPTSFGPERAKCLNHGTRHLLVSPLSGTAAASTQPHGCLIMGGGGEEGITTVGKGRVGDEVAPSMVHTHHKGRHFWTHKLSITNHTARMGTQYPRSCDAPPFDAPPLRDLNADGKRPVRQYPKTYKRRARRVQ